MSRKRQKSLSDLGRRERQIMDVIHRLGDAGVSEVLKEIPDAPSYSSVRTMIRILESKGLLRHRREGMRYVYRATQPVEQVRRSALRHLLKTFFNDSPSDAVAALLELSPDELSDQELSRLTKMIDEAKKRGQ
ncbi:MAG: BlaI/MecI/CopY family transcriptional regulator [Pirellulaceae bacterium]